MWCLETLEKINQESDTEDAREIYKNLGIITMEVKDERRGNWRERASEEASIP